MQQLKLNIIFLPGTVKYLKFFTYSLIQHLNCSFRLVSNACTAEEEFELQNIANDYDTVSFYSLKTNEIMEHHDALNQLLMFDDAEYWGIIDSDIFATQNFFKDINLNNSTPFFSGNPIWQDVKDVVWDTNELLKGRHIITSQNDVVGCTFLAIYNYKALRRFYKEYGFGFDRFLWDNIPQSIQTYLIEAGLKANAYDTGKILNIMLQKDSEKATYMELEGMYHIGGISTKDVLQRKNKLRKATDKEELMIAQINKKIKQKGLSEVVVTKHKVDDRLQTAYYFKELLYALIDKTPLPDLPEFSCEIAKQRILSLEEEMIELYNSYADEF